MNEQHEQLQLDLQGELDLESIRREYESEQLWKDARYLAETTGYTAQEMEDLTQELALVGLQYSRKFKLSTEEGGRSLRVYVVDMMKKKRPRFIDKIERSRLPYSVSRADHQTLQRLDRECDSIDEQREQWVESGHGRTSEGFDLLHYDVDDSFEFEDHIVAVPNDENDEEDERKALYDSLLDGEQLELWSVFLDDEDKGRHGLGKDSILAVYTLHRANPEMSDLQLSKVLGHDGDNKWVRRRIDRAVRAIQEFYKINVEG